MSFTCKACGRQRSGSTGEGQEVCMECRPTQMGQAALLLRHFEHYDHFNAPKHIDALDEILAEAGNPLSDDEADGSITEPRWNRLNRLARAAREFHAALDAAIPQGHQKEW